MQLVVCAIILEVNCPLRLLVAWKKWRSVQSTPGTLIYLKLEQLKVSCLTSLEEQFLLFLLLAKKKTK